MRAKVAQEKVIVESGFPYSIVRATQFFEFVDGIADSLTDGDTVRAPHGAFQPIAAADVATAVTRAAAGDPSNGVINIAGPEKLGMDDFIRTRFRRNRRCTPGGDRSPTARYFGAVLDDAQHRSRRRRRTDRLPHQLQRLDGCPGAQRDAVGIRGGGSEWN